jgi:predicted Ser/Thr protein kinase
MRKVEFERKVIDFDKAYCERLGRVSTKVINLLGRKLKNPVDCYLLLKVICFSFEEDFEFHLEPQEESKLRKMMLPECENCEG